MQSARENIILIGMPGVGKSTVGVVLAKILGYQFVDVDLLIQQKCDKTLQRIIDEEGSEHFIAIEAEVLGELNCERTIISTGGSACYSPDAVQALKSREIPARTVYLEGNLDELKRHLGDFSARGIVVRDPSISSLDELLAERAPLYEGMADITVNIDGLDITQSARSVVHALEAAPALTPARTPASESAEEA